MSDEIKNGPEGGANMPAGGDEIKNLKAEVNRKLENTNAKLDELLNSLKNVTTARPVKTETKKVSVFEDEDAYAASIKQDVLSQVEKARADEAKRQAKFSQVLTPLYNDYPELNDANSSLMKLAEEKFKQVPEDERTSAVAMKAAVMEAVAEMGVKPRSKRSADDSFSLSGGSNSSSRSKTKSGLTEGHLLAAQLLGLNTKDPQVKKNLEKRASRESWTKWKSTKDEE
jgi:hypothetical protein